MRFLVAVFSCIFVISLTQSIRTMISLSHEISSDEDTVEPRERHIGVFLPSPGSLFFDEIREGAEAAASEYNVGLSFHSIDTDDSEFLFARYSGIDGAIIYPYGDEAEMRRCMDELEEAGIPVVLIERGVPSDWPFTFVGTNNFDMGRRIGALVGTLIDDPMRLTVVYSEKSPRCGFGKRTCGTRYNNGSRRSSGRSRGTAPNRS